MTVKKPTELFDEALNLHSKGMLDKAAELYIQIIEQDSTLMGAYNNLGIIFAEQGDLKGALNILETAYKINEDNLDINFSLANVHNRLKNNQTAIDFYLKVTRLEPNHGASYFQIAKVLMRGHDPAQAKNFFLKACEVSQTTNPGFALTCISEYLYAAMQVCEWDNIAQYTKLLEDNLPKLWESKQNNFLNPFLLQMCPCSDSFKAMNSKIAAKSFEVNARKFEHPPKANTATDKKIKLGYISPDFNEHTVALLLGDLFKHHNRDKFEVYAYLTIDKQDKFTQVIQDSVDELYDYSMLNHLEIANNINKQGIDILIDLTGFSGNVQLAIMAQRPAPIQIQWLGYMGSMHADYFQYFIGDKVVCDNKTEFSEKLIELPHSFIATKIFEEKQVTRQQFALPEDKFIYCCFVKSYRITEKFFKDVIDILEQTPDSILWLYYEHNQTVENLTKFAKANYPEFDTARLYFYNQTITTEHMGLQVADLYLDTYELSGATSTILSLSVNLPVITKLSTNAVGRVTGSLLTTAGVPELICKDEAEYKNLALEFYNNRDKLAEIKNKLSKTRDSNILFNQQQFIDELEQALLKL